MDDLSIAYCAGVIDSDGCITIKSRKRTVKNGDFAKVRSYSASIFVRQVESQAVELLSGMFGGSTRVHASSTPNGRPLNHWEVSHSKAEAAAVALLPYLRIKKRQAEILIEFCRFISNNDARRHPFWFEWADGESTYTVKEAAAIKGVSLFTVWQLVGNKTIPVRRECRRLLIPRRFWDNYQTGRRGRTLLPAGYVAWLENICARIRNLNGPTRGIRTTERIS